MTSRHYGISLGLFLCFMLLPSGVLCDQGSFREEPFKLGSNEFPIGMFSVDSVGAMDEVKKMGLTYVHTYAQGSGNDSASIARYLAYLDKAHKRGLNVMFNLQGHRWVAKKNGVSEWSAPISSTRGVQKLTFHKLFSNIEINSIRTNGV